VPKSDNIKKLSASSVVDEVLNSGQVQPANNVGARSFNLGADTGFFNEQGQGRLYILANSSWGGRPILGPPHCCSFDFPLRTGLDLGD